MSLLNNGTTQSHIQAEGDVVGRDKYTVDNSTKNFFEIATALTSTLATVVNALGKKMPEEDGYVFVTDFSVEHKKDHNNVQVYRYIMDDYGLFTGKLAVVYATLDAEGTDITFNTLNNIRLHYVKVRSEYMIAHPQLSLIEVVRMYADKIFAEVEQRLLTNVVSSTNLASPIESVQLSVQVVMIDAFIKCKILEHPTQNVAS
jgi:hypothetical protein